MTGVISSINKLDNYNSVLLVVSSTVLGSHFNEVVIPNSDSFKYSVGEDIEFSPLTNELITN